MAEGQGSIRDSANIQNQAQLFVSPEVSSRDTTAEKLIFTVHNVPFSKVPVQPESSHARSFSSSGNISSPVFKPRRRRQRSQCSESEDDENPVDGTSSSDNYEPFRPRSNAVVTKNMHKRKKVRQQNCYSR